MTLPSVWYSVWRVQDNQQLRTQEKTLVALFVDRDMAIDYAEEFIRGDTTQYIIEKEE
jgi:hypothetical protein